MRTSFEVRFVLGVPLPQYNLPPFAAALFRFTWNPQGKLIAGADEDSGSRHPICKVLEWEQRFQAENSLTRAQLARKEGTTKAYVTQMLRLTNLPEETRQYLSVLLSLETICSFSLRRLAMAAKLSAVQWAGRSMSCHPADT